MFNNFEPVAHLSLPRHRVYISKNDQGSILCFKYDQNHCDFNIFSESETDLASEYVLENLPEIWWGFCEDNTKSLPNY